MTVRFESIASSLVALALLAPGVALAQSQTEDVETVKPQAPTAGKTSDLPWYVPPQGAAYVPPAPPPPPRTEPTDEEKMRGGTLQLNIEPTFFIGSGESPTAAALIRMAWPGIGFDIGYSGMQGGAFVLGISTLHYAAELVHDGENHLYLMLPELDARLLYAPGLPSGDNVTGAFGGSLLALRFARCLGRRVSFLGEVRGPVAFAYVPSSGASVFGSVGFSGSLGIGF
jgi:hypothetical protein